MKLLIALMATSSIVFAGRIVPNIEWNQTSINETGSAAAFGSRANNLSLGYTNYQSEEENNSDNDSESNTTSLISYHKSGDYVFEIAAIMAKYDYESEDRAEYANFIFGNVGRKYGDLSVGLSLLHINYAGYNAYEMIASMTYKIEDLYLGFSVDRNYSNSSEFNYLGYYAGVGYMTKMMSVEAVLGHQPSAKKENENSSEYVDTENSLTLQGTINLNRFQLSPKLYTASEFDEDDNKWTEKNISLKGEFEVSRMFYIGATTALLVRDYKDDDDSDYDDIKTTTMLGMNARIKKDSYQIEFKYEAENSETEYEDGTDDKKEEDKTITLIGSIFY